MLFIVTTTTILVSCANTQSRNRHIDNIDKSMNSNQIKIIYEKKKKHYINIKINDYRNFRKL